VAKLTIAFAAILIALGVASWAATMSSWTALIPAIFGALFLLFGLVALKESLRMHAMHASSLLALLVILAGGGRFFSKIGETGFTLPMTMTLVMVILTIGYLAACVNSFIQARRRRRLAEQQPA
jgi:hypothetical protein